MNKKRHKSKRVQRLSYNVQELGRIRRKSMREG